jgi:hypothetical protein
VKSTGRDCLRLLRAALAGLALVLGSTAAAAGPLALEAVPVPLDPKAPDRNALDALRYLGGLELLAVDDSRFGGFSGLRISADGVHLLAVSDRGDWLSARLLYDADDRLIGIADAALAPLSRPPGRGTFDVEALEVLPNGALLIATERVHRLLRYDPPKQVHDPFVLDADRLARLKPKVLAAPEGFAALGGNEGIEALVRLEDGRLLAIEEGGEGRPAVPAQAWLIGADGTAARLAIRRDANFRPTDAALLPDGDVLLLERRYTAIGGVAARLRGLPQAELVAGAVVEGVVLATLVPPVSVDNMEGLAVRQANGRTLVLLLSDDNFNDWQRTLLLQFELQPAR